MSAAMSQVFDLIRASSSVDALEMLCRSHPEAAINVTALREELDAADEQIEQLARALRKAVEPPTFMGEPVPHPANRAARIAMDPQRLREPAAAVAEGPPECWYCKGTGKGGSWQGGEHDGGQSATFVEHECDGCDGTGRAPAGVGGTDA